MTPLVDRRPDYDELLRLAEAAGEEAWDLWSWASWQEAPPDILDGSPRPDMFDLLPFQSRRNVAFTVEARPDVVAALIRENRQQAERIAALEKLLRKSAKMPTVLHWSGDEDRPHGEFRCNGQGWREYADNTCDCKRIDTILAESRP